MNDSTEFLGPNAILISSIRDMLSENGFFGLKHMRRHANSIAHKLARFIFSCIRPFTWTFVGFLYWLQDLVIKDI